MVKNSGFEAKVLVTLEYIKKKQDEHDIILNQIQTESKTRLDNCRGKFEAIDAKINKAEGFAKGAMAVGGLGLFGTIANWFK